MKADIDINIPGGLGMDKGVLLLLFVIGIVILILLLVVLSGNGETTLPSGWLDNHLLTGYHSAAGLIAA